MMEPLKDGELLTTEHNLKKAYIYNKTTKIKQKTWNQQLKI
jgi:hypothetical protein